MILDKIPRIECVLIIPELITDDLNNLIKDLIGKKKSLKILKKNKKRIKTGNYINNIINKSKESNKLINEYEIILKLFNDPYNFEKFSNIELFNSFIESLEINEKKILTKFIINHLDKIINIYIKILVHIDDQVFVLSKLNKDNKKIFLKFFLPKIKKDLEYNINLFDETINSQKDNIHMTILPTTEGHGLDGLFHITFRIEGKNNIIFEYTKYASLNIDINKLGVGIYPDEKCINSLIFKIIENIPKFIELLKLKKLSQLNEDILNLKNYNNMLEYITLDILNKLKLANKLEYIYQKYFFSLGKETIKTIIDKLFKIVICTFVDLYFDIN